MAQHTPLKFAALAAACLAVASGCSTRQKTAGETMLDAPRHPDAAVAMAPAPEMVPAPAPAVAVPAVVAPPVATPAAVDAVGLAKTGSGTLTLAGPPAPGADQAAIMRGWGPVISYYQNGNVIAGPVYRLIPPPAASNSEVDRNVVDYYATVLAVPQFFATPIWMLFTPPLTEVPVHGVEFAPSYTLDDPIDTSREKSLGIIKLTRD